MIHYEAATGSCPEPRLLRDCPSGEGCPMELQVPFGAEPSTTRSARPPCAVPGVPAASTHLGVVRDAAVARLVEPALALARDGATVTPAHARAWRCSSRSSPSTRAPGSLARAARSVDGERCSSRARRRARGDRGGRGGGLHRHPRGALLALCEKRGRDHPKDLSAYEARWTEPEEGRSAARASSPAAACPACRRRWRATGARRRGRTERVLALVDLLAAGPPGDGDTTNIVTLDPAGNVCVVTTSPGAGLGRLPPGLDSSPTAAGEAELLLGTPNQASELRG